MYLIYYKKYEYEYYLEHYRIHKPLQSISNVSPTDG